MGTPSQVARGRRAVAVAVVLIVGGACGPAEVGERDPGGTAETASSGPAAEPEAAATRTAGSWLDDVRIGREVDRQGAIPESGLGDEFAPGERVYASMSVAGAPPAASVHVIFENGDGETMAEDEKKVPAEARYLYLDSGDTTDWRPGSYRLIVAVDGQVVARRGFTMGSPGREGGAG